MFFDVKSTIDFFDISVKLSLILFHFLDLFLEVIHPGLEIFFILCQISLFSLILIQVLLIFLFIFINLIKLNLQLTQLNLKVHPNLINFLIILALFLHILLSLPSFQLQLLLNFPYFLIDLTYFLLHMHLRHLLILRLLIDLFFNALNLLTSFIFLL